MKVIGLLDSGSGKCQVIAQIADPCLDLADGCINVLCRVVDDHPAAATDQCANATAIRRDHRHAGGKRFVEHDSPRFGLRRKQEAVDRIEELLFALAEDGTNVFDQPGMFFYRFRDQPFGFYGGTRTGQRESNIGAFIAQALETYLARYRDLSQP